MASKLSGLFHRRVPPGAQPDAQESLGPQEVQNDAADYGVHIQPANVLPGAWYWQAIRIHHLTPVENGGNHHIYLDLYERVADRRGRWSLQRVDGGRLKVTWQGGEQVLTIDKPANEPGTNLPMWREQVCSVVALGAPGQELPSDRVVGIHTGHPDEGPGTTRFHHSFAIAFQKVRARAATTAGAGPAPFAHYVLFGPAEHPATLASLWLAQEYLLTFRPAFGFSPDEAAHAGLVTILANPEVVAPAVETRLTAAGARVERIEGNVSEVAHALAARVQHGER